jgi:hypothetical protein
VLLCVSKAEITLFGHPKLPYLVTRNYLIWSPIQEEIFAQPAVEMSVAVGGEDGTGQVQSLANSIATHETSTRWVRVGGGQKRLWQGRTGAAVMAPLSDSAGMVNTVLWPKGLRNKAASSFVMEKLHNLW